jgi:hypothetical protein
MSGKWIQEALKNHEKGALHKQLGIPESERIPNLLLNKIVNAGTHKIVENPTLVGKAEISVTPLLFRRSLMAKNMRESK